VVHNAFSYHLTPGGFIMEHGLHAIGCAVIPGGTGAIEQQLEAIARYSPTGYVGTPDFLKMLLDGAEKSGAGASFKRALVSGAALPATLRQELIERGVEVLQCYAIAEVGVIAYERPGCSGMIVNETLIVEIVRPGSGEPVAEGDVGEIVVTSLNADFPMIRSRPATSPPRSRAPLPRAPRSRVPRPAGAPTCASRVGSAVPTKHEDQRLVRASGPGGRRCAAAPRTWPCAPLRDARRRGRHDDSCRGMRRA